MNVAHEVPLNRTLTRCTTLRAYVDGVDWSAFRTAVSLHSHTRHSREVLSDLPVYIRRIPVVGSRIDRELNDRHAAIDLAKGWWHPPVSPRQVFDSEIAQIERRFGLDSMVSVTDHDEIAANLELQRLFAARRAPISCEWTVPVHEGFFHLGIHDLPPERAADWFARLIAFFAGRPGDRLRDILDDLHAAGTLIVFNHPLWDLAGVGESTHATWLREFLDAYGSRLHALEINGYRSRAENGGVRSLSAERGLPLISGGDRHATAPNALLNLTRATTFAEFAAEVRDGVSHIVVMPEYKRHITVRIFESAADVVASYRGYPVGWQHWTDRVSYVRCGMVEPLSRCWPDGGPRQLRWLIAAFRVLSSPVPRRLWGTALEQLDGPAPISSIPAVG